MIATMSSVFKPSIAFDVYALPNEPKVKLMTDVGPSFSDWVLSCITLYC